MTDKLQNDAHPQMMNRGLLPLLGCSSFGS
jgi:hypothetical protein